MTYQEYKDNKQAEFNALPIFFAFGMEQFKGCMEERGLTENDVDKVYSIGSGGYYLKKDADVVRAYFNREDELPELMKEYDFAFGAFYYEMCNHEYCINLQRYWDVCSCFCDKELPFYDDDYFHESVKMYADIMKWTDTTRRAYVDAERAYYKAAEENGWG